MFRFTLIINKSITKIILTQNKPFSKTAIIFKVIITKKNKHPKKSMSNPINKSNNKCEIQWFIRKKIKPKFKNKISEKIKSNSNNNKLMIKHQIILIVHFHQIPSLVLVNYLNHNIKCIILLAVEDLAKFGKFKVERIIKVMQWKKCQKQSIFFYFIKIKRVISKRSVNSVINERLLLTSLKRLQTP